jgi:hypothetical protein
MKLLKATPIDFYDIILEFSDGSFRKFSPAEVKLNGARGGFLVQPNTIKAFRFSPDELIWYNGIRLDCDFIFDYSTTISPQELLHTSLMLGFRNNAPTLQDSSHHEYRAQINPYNREKPITLCESIGGGHAERGGCTSNTLAEILKMDWQDHFRKSDCEWAIEIVKSEKNNIPELIDKLIKAVCERFYSTMKD